MKTKQELENIKERLEKLSTELHELTDEELEQVTGGNRVLRYYCFKMEQDHRLSGEEKIMEQTGKSDIVTTPKVR